MTSSKEWQGRVGQVWADHAVALDAMLSPMGDAGLDAMGQVSGQCVLDIGCGAGDSVVKLAARGAQVVGVDISDDLLAVARARCAHLDADLRVGDAASIGLDRSVDQIYSRFGCMFFEDPLAAWSHIRSQVSDGTPMTLVAWGDAAVNDWATLPVKLARTVLGADIALPKNGELGPFAWGDPTGAVAILGQAGWRDIKVEKIKKPILCSMGDDHNGLENGLNFVMTIGRLAGLLKGLPVETRMAVRDVLRDGLREHMVDNTLMLQGEAWIVKGTA